MVTYQVSKYLLTSAPQHSRLARRLFRLAAYSIIITLISAAVVAAMLRSGARAEEA